MLLCFVLLFGAVACGNQTRKDELSEMLAIAVTADDKILIVNCAVKSARGNFKIIFAALPDHRQLQLQGRNVQIADVRDAVDHDLRHSLVDRFLRY